jgi:hypothetical protein
MFEILSTCQDTTVGSTSTYRLIDALQLGGIVDGASAPCSLCPVEKRKRCESTEVCETMLVQMMKGVRTCHRFHLPEERGHSVCIGDPLDQ